MILIVVSVFMVTKGINVLKNIAQICVVEEGALKYEEGADGYILRDEIVLEGENSKNGMVQIVSEGEKVAKDKPVFRYYSNGEDDILKQIDTLDSEINAEIESSGLTIFSTDITNLENEIEAVVDSMYNINDIEDLQDRIAELNSYVSKKTIITGSLSPADSHVKTLIEQRNKLEESLSQGSEIINAPMSGMVSYRIDGLEPLLGVNDFGYLNTNFLKSLDTRTGAIIPTSTQQGKIINNFSCYIACTINTEKASVAKEGDSVMLRLPSGKEIEAEIVHIVQENDFNRIIVFKISENVEELVQYRKINLQIIWWSFRGLKVSNSAILEENDISYVERTKSGYTDKIYVKVLRQNDTYSIVENYTEEELEKLGLKSDDVKNRKRLNVYDEILLH